ncbi:MAG TPA: sulfatase-like hydrolase/transferase [Acidimicrobiia bacterium]|jgi:arylsulfatase A-like enzyme
MGRKILFITTDQQRYDALGCNGGQIARTPVVDGLAASGIRYERAYNQNTVCMPARSTMLTGQYVRTHGVIANGVPLPEDAPSIAEHLRDRAGYHTALLGKGHFEPGFDFDLRWAENFMSERGLVGPYRGFEHAELAMHVPSVGKRALQHYGRWLIDTHGIDATKGFSPLLAAEPGGETGAPETRINPIPREWYHTDWVADRTIAYLDSLPDDADWFVWMSFPDPHHPWDPPSSELHRCNWRDLDLPPGHPGSNDDIEQVLAQKPAHWLALWDGRFINAEGGPGTYRPQNVSHDSIREINAMTHIMNELIDEACGRVLARVAQRGWDADTDVIFTTDHGELQGDFGLMFKGPFHVDALMRLPMVWRPAPSAGVAPSTVSEPVGQLDLAPTFCDIAGVAVPDWVQGAPLPTAPGSGRERVLCEWDSQFPGYGMHLRSIYRDQWVCTTYERSTVGEPNGLEEFFAATGLFGGGIGPTSSVTYDGTEGELYDLDDDPRQFVNRWDDPECKARREDLLADLYDHLPAERTILKVERPA